MGVIIHEDSAIYSGNNARERLKKEEEYLEYIEDHIKNVHTAYESLMKPLLNKTNISTVVSDEDLFASIKELEYAIDHHDDSKFSDAEFDGYRAKYYPTANEENAGDEYQQQINSRYEDCWKHHYLNNDHHPEHWFDFEKETPRDMSLLAILHMLCDWEAMSIAFKGTTLDWYENDNVSGKRDKEKYFTTRTKEIVEDLMYNVLYN